MSDYVISCCSTADLSAEHFAARKIEVVPFHYELDGVQYVDDLGQTMDYDEFYRRMAAGAETKTSQPSIGQFMELWEPFLKEGKDIVHASLSSGISGVIDSATAARSTLFAKYPQRTIRVIDSLGASSGYGLLVDKLADLRDQGMTVDEAADWAEGRKLNVHHWFFSTDLSFYVRGGRISRTAGFVGGVLKICPLLNMDGKGRLVPREKIRSKQRAIKEIVKRMAEHAEGGTGYSGKCYISQSACYNDAREVADLVEAAFPQLDGPVEINHVGTTIGSHTGPGTVALFFWGDKRVD